MEQIRRFRGGAAALAFLMAIVASSQVVPDLRPFGGGEPDTFTLSAAGDAHPRLAPIRLTFAKAPQERQPEALLQLFPKADGEYAWLTPRTLLFQPAFPGLLRGATYTALVPARPEAGVPQPVTRSFTVAGKLAVQQIIPSDGDNEVPLQAQVIVQF
ncbi:MAG TPA: hypothetical protein VFM06_09015, partial [Candidatus Limnocylindria bacterium]|nr:hypothetical protein [Candidatus Limnocylindria bacterium]